MTGNAKGFFMQIFLLDVVQVGQNTIALGCDSVKSLANSTLHKPQSGNTLLNPICYFTMYFKKQLNT